MTAPQPEGWRRASSCTSSGNCLEVRSTPGVVAVRDSKRPDVPPLVVRAEDWVAFLTAAKAGEFDDLV